MLAEKHLTRLGFTVEQATEFITANINQPKIIYETAAQYGVTTRMLSELSGYSRDIISGYFKDAGLTSTELDKAVLVNSDLGSLENLVAFNTREGILSNTALRDVVKPEIIERLYDYDSPISSPFSSPNPALQLKDGVYSSGELGVENLDNVPANIENIESLFYGTLINAFLTLDNTEYNQINNFPSNGNPEDYQTLLLNALSESPPSIAWSDEQLAGYVTTEAINVLDKFWNASLYGVLDHSYLGLATA